MSFDPVPAFIGGGAEHSPDVFRLLNFAATLGSEGVVGVGSLKVSALDTPGAGFNVATGAVVMLNRSPGGGLQSYMARMPTVLSVTGLTPVPSGGSGRSDLVVARVKDPQYSPWTPPDDPVVGPYVEIFVIEDVPSSTRSAASLGLGYSAVALARLDRPASSSTLLSAHIVDLREVVISRQEREVELVFPSGAVVADAANNTYKTLASTGSTALSIPSWATTAVVSASVSGLAVITAAVVGKLRAAIVGASYTQETVVDENYGGSISRCHYLTAGRIAIPADLRGTDRQLILQGTRTSGTGRFQVDTGSTVVFDVQFQERAE